MKWQISQRFPNGEVKGIEKAAPWLAQRSVLILSAHELKNGRAADFIITPPVDLDLGVERFALPDWALEELKKAGMR